MTGTVERQEVLHLDRSRLGAVERTQVGGARIKARLSRTGVLTYINPDGTRRRELRLPEEIFKADSLKTLEHAPVIDITDHTGMVDTASWKKVNLGHTVNVGNDGRYMTGELIVNDKQALDAIESGERGELSCGYRCTLDMTPGTYEGEAYDCIQRDIHYNHVALCPPNRGRAGPDVSLRFDSNAPLWGTSDVEESEGDSIMSNAATIIKVRLDGRDYDQGSEAHLAKLDETMTTLRLDAKAAGEKLAEVTKRADTLEAERDTAKETLGKLEEKIKLDAAEVVEKSKRAVDEEKEMKRHRRKMERIAFRYFGDDSNADDKTGGNDVSGKCPSCGANNDGDAKSCAKCGENLPQEKKRQKRDFPPGAKAPPFKKGGEKGEKDDDDDDDDKKSRKLDAFEERVDSMSNRDLMLYCIKQAAPDFDGEKKSDDYLQARFDSIVESIKSNRGINGVVAAARANALHLDAGDEDKDPVSIARAKRDKEMADAWKKPFNATGSDKK